MSGENQIPLEVLVEIKDALGRLQKFEQDAKKTTSNVEKAFDTMKTVAKAAVAVFAAKQVADFFEAGIDAAVAQQDAMQRLATAMEATGEKSDEALAKIADFANQMEASTKYGDDLVISQVAIAKSFGLSNDEAEKLVKTAADLASATGDTLDGAVQKLGKTYSGTTGKLDDMVPALRGLTKEQLANGEAVRVLAERYGGAAEKEVKTFSGALLQAKNAVGNFQEAFGTVIVENPAVIEAINGIAQTFGLMEGAVTDNKSALSALVTGGVKVFAFAAVGVVDLVYDISTAFQTTTRVLSENSVSLAKWAKLAGYLTGTLSPVIGATIEGVIATAAASAKGLADSSKAFNESFAKIRASVGLSAQKIMLADDQVGASADKAKGKRKDFARQVGEDAKEIEKLAEAAAKFEDQLRQSTADEASNVQAKLQEQLDQISDFESKKVISSKHAEELRVIAVSTAMEKIDKIHADALEKQKAAEEKATADFEREMQKRKAAVEAAASNPAAYGVGKLGIKTADIDPSTAQGIGAGVGVLGNALEGAAGARSLISAGAGAFAEALVPGLGPAITSVVSKLAEGPEATKKFVREFIAAVPDIMQAVGESVPVVVEALVDSLINEGGALKIGVAITRAMYGEAIWKAIGKQLGLEFGRTFNAGPMADAARGFGRRAGEALSDGAKALGAKISTGMKAGASSLTTAMEKGAERVGAALSRAWGQAVDAAGKLTKRAIMDAWHEVNRKLYVDLPKAIARGVFVTLPGKIRDGFLLGLDVVKAGLGRLFEGIGGVFTKAADTLARVVDGFGRLVASVPDAIARGFDAIRGFLQYDVPAAWKAAGLAISDRWKEAGGAVSAGFKGAIADFVTASKVAGGEWSEKVREAIGGAVSAVKESISDLVSGWHDMFAGVTQPIQDALDSFEWPTIYTPEWLLDFINTVDDLIATPAWMQRFEDAVHQLTDWSIGGDDGSGGTNIPIAPGVNVSTKGKVSVGGRHLATGGVLGGVRGTLIPGAGYRDMVPWVGTPGELVLNKEQVAALRGAAGGSGDSGMVAELLSQLIDVVASLSERPVAVAIDGRAITSTVQRANYRNARMK